ncbi:hypothetical protein C7964_102490 [Loktanella sp. PT4BL]|nr:hypothetical protein C7964_102490 [Loktanella sp. PT4BL]
MPTQADSTHESAAFVFLNVKIPTIRYPTWTSGITGDVFKSALCLTMIDRTKHGSSADHLFAELGPSPLSPGCANGLSVR